VQTTAYKTSVRPPINADGTSVFNKRRGVIPVQFSLQAARGPFTLYSDTGNASADDDYGYASFTPTTPLTFGQLDTLKADYQFVDGDCYGGSLRWSVRVDSNLNGVSDPYDPYTNPGGDGAIFIYYGTYSSWDMCGGDINGPNQSGLNMIGMPDLRYDSTQLGGPWYGSYDQALAIAGGFNVWRASLGIDSGWVSRQEMTLGSATVNDRTFTPLPAQALAPTCDLPQAEIKVTKKDPNSGPEINETVDSVQNKDTGVYFRIVDCKYIYNLDVSTIDPNLSTRAGTYYVAAKIGGAVVGDRAQFDLR